jgi:hypothetical protein
VQLAQAVLEQITILKFVVQAEATHRQAALPRQSAAAAVDQLMILHTQLVVEQMVVQAVALLVKQAHAMAVLEHQVKAITVVTEVLMKLLIVQQVVVAVQVQQQLTEAHQPQEQQQQVELDYLPIQHLVL